MVMFSGVGFCSANCQWENTEVKETYLLPCWAVVPWCEASVWEELEAESKEILQSQARRMSEREEEA
jgi:hypothetical protein